MIAFPTPAHVRRLTARPSSRPLGNLLGARSTSGPSSRRSGRRRTLSRIASRPRASLSRRSGMTLRQFQQLTGCARRSRARAEEVLATTRFRPPQSLPGIGPIIALTILAEAGDLRRFGSSPPVPEVLRLRSREDQSGVYRGREQLSKRGNAQPAPGVLAPVKSRSVIARTPFSTSTNAISAPIPLMPTQAQGAHRRGGEDGARCLRHVKTDQPYRQFFEHSFPADRSLSAEPSGRRREPRTP